MDIDNELEFDKEKFKKKHIKVEKKKSTLNIKNKTCESEGVRLPEATWHTVNSIGNGFYKDYKTGQIYKEISLNYKKSEDNEDAFKFLKLGDKDNKCKQKKKFKK